MRVARSIGGSGEPIESVKVCGSGNAYKRYKDMQYKKQEVNLLPQSVAYEMAVFLASWAAWSLDGMI